MKDDPKSHQAYLTYPKRRNAIDLEEWDWVGDGPFATFNFHYRSLEFLQAMWIAPRPTEEPLADAPALPPARNNNNKRRARDHQADRPEQDSVIEIDDDSDIDIISSQPVRKRRLERIGATQDEAIDVDDVSEDEGAEVIKKRVAVPKRGGGNRRRGSDGRFVRG
ncbi:hypothetical protein CC86DRAFT_15858 [Ophiobolus disseminans]|uniref:DUF7918 domain-containing protein n=1 Tax=Ophiobolus disseminans TaxID=1469910 RepID=A0A6A7AKS3_9PLEO|nr:hypothetical protein CC86DRAFT_15858 [Ophiobolus disseminans]